MTNADITTLPLRSGVSLKSEYFDEILHERPDIGWFEIHPENYLGGGASRYALMAIAEHYPISVHSVGLSVAGESPICAQHLGRLKAFLDDVKPAAFSEHLAWSIHDGVFYNDLLPIPYTRETLIRVCERVDLIQNSLERQVLIENPSLYGEFASSDIAEAEFLSELAERTRCRLLLDINNIVVTAINAQRDPCDYLDAFALDHVGEIHLAGHRVEQNEDLSPVAIDTHDRTVSHEVWQLFEAVIERSGPIPCLIEWDAKLPTFETLLSEASFADEILRRNRHVHGVVAHG